MNLRRILLVVSMLTLVLFACDEEIEPGVNCAADSDCGELSCFCSGTPIPGTCSKSCNTDDNCASLGDGYTGRIDFCSAPTRNVNIWLG